MKNLIWVEESLIKKLQLLDECEEIHNDKVQEVIKGFNSSIEDLSDCVDANVLEFRAKAQRIRDSYKKVVDEELEVTNKLWEDLDTKRYAASRKIKEASDSIASVSKDVSNLKQQINNIDFYAIDRLIETIDKISRIDDKQLELLGKLFK